VFSLQEAKNNKIIKRRSCTSFFLKLRDLKKIGVLLPQSKAYPRMGKEFMNGLRLSLKDDSVEFKIEGIGNGSDSKDVINAIQKLVNQEGVSLTTGMLGHKGIDEIYDFVEAIDETLLYSDIGGTLGLSLEKRKGIYCNSFDICRSMELLTEYLLKNDMKNIGISSCYYDAGYSFLQAIENVLSQNNSAGFAGHFITPLQPRDNEAELMTAFAETCKPDAIIGFHNGLFAEEHASYLRQNKVNKQIPMYLTPFSVNDTILKEYSKELDSVHTAASWYPELNNDENKKFIKEYMEEFGAAPSIFSLLGFENGLLIQKVQKNSINDEIKGPRGNFSIDKNTNRTNFNHYLWELSSSEKGNGWLVKDKLNNNENVIQKKFVDSNNEGGWNNAYLCH